MSKSQPSSERALEGGHYRMPMEDDDFTGGEVEQADLAGSDDVHDDGDWLNLAQRAFSDSSDFFDGDVRRRIEESMALYRSEHPAGSKYNSPAFAKRSRLFRPKTRAAMRKMEAAAALAYFSTKDVIDISAVNKGDKEQIKAARAQSALLNYRLNNTVPWFQFMMGSIQDAQRQGFVIAATEWEWVEGKRYYTETDQFTGATVRKVERFVRKDTPKVRLIAAENMRLDPGCDWMDPINSSPYLIELIPYKIHEIREMMDDPRQRLPFRELSDEQLLSGRGEGYDSIRNRREGGRQDRYDHGNTITDYTTVWVHKNIMRVDGEDYVFLTVGTEHLLTDPIPLSEIDGRGYRPYVFGTLVIDSHNPMPDGPVQMGKPVQEEINEVTNMRADGVKMATIGRYFTRRNSNIDLDALVRMVPGASIEVTDISRDIKWDRAPEVNRSAYEEQNQLQLEYDDLIGNFSGASVGANRNLNETVGGMSMLGEGASILTELALRSHCETFTEPVLRQLVDLQALYETDTTIAAIVGDEIGMTIKQVFEAMEVPVKVEADVGFGSTNPLKRVEKLRTALGTLAEVAPEIMQEIDHAEVAHEIFGALGYRNADRFFPSLADREGEEDPRIAQLEEQIAELTQMVETKQMEYESRERIAQLNNEAKLQIEQMRQTAAAERDQMKHELQSTIEAMRSELRYTELQIRYEQNDHRLQELRMQREALSHTIQMAEREFALKTQTMTMAPPPNPTGEPIPEESAALVQALKQPPEGQAPMNEPPAPPAQTGDTANVGGDDKAGVIARGKYGNIPFAEG